MDKNTKIALVPEWKRYQKQLGEQQAMQMREKYYKLVLGEDNLEKAAVNYLERVLELPKLCKQTQGQMWSTFKKNLMVKDGKYHYLLPFFWTLTGTGFENAPAVEFNPEHTVGAALTWRFIFDQTAPIVTLAAVFRLIEIWIDVLAEADPAPNMIVKKRLLCNYIDAFAKFAENMDLKQICAKYLQGWNKATTKESPAQNLKIIDQYINNVRPPLPFQWYNQTRSRQQQLKDLERVWTKEQHSRPDDQAAPCK